MPRQFTLYYEDTGEPFVVIESTQDIRTSGAIEPVGQLTTMRTHDGLLVENTDTKGRYLIDNRRYATRTPPPSRT
jgi:hypothetical protein